MLLEAALNGARTRSEHPALPIHPRELAEAARAALVAGAGAVHFHPRSSDGRESLASEDVARAVSVVREVCGTTPLGVSTGTWIEPDAERRLALVRGWRVLPDFASVNFHEPGAVELAKALLELGTAVEAGLASDAAAERLVASALGPRCLRLLIEPSEEDLPGALATVASIEQALARSRGRVPRLLHGVGATAWPLLVEAVRRGYDARMGLEDTLRTPAGAMAADNAELIRLARSRCVVSGSRRESDGGEWISG